LTCDLLVLDGAVEGLGVHPGSNEGASGIKELDARKAKRLIGPYVGDRQ